MCQYSTNNEERSQNQSNDSWQNHAQRQEQLYPNLDSILNNIMTENQSQFLRDFFAGNPTAPNQEQGQHQGHHQGQCHNSCWQRPQNDEDEFTWFFKQIGKKMVKQLVHSFAFFALILPVLMAPKFLLVLGIFAAILKSLNIPLSVVVIASLAYEVLWALDPILITLLAFWTMWKVWYMRRPLIDLDYWRNRIQVLRH